MFAWTHFPCCKRTYAQNSQVFTVDKSFAVMRCNAATNSTEQSGAHISSGDQTTPHIRRPWQHNHHRMITSERQGVLNEDRDPLMGASACTNPYTECVEPGTSFATRKCQAGHVNEAGVCNELLTYTFNTFNTASSAYVSKSEKLSSSNLFQFMAGVAVGTILSSSFSLLYMRTQLLYSKGFHFYNVHAAGCGTLSTKRLLRRVYDDLS